ncbi:MAG: (Fe-S)-binding protein [Dehalococcoidales bacterium]|nr:(Fe-S)-binding protein [Dehalococcoidales bacterium]
MAPLDSMLFGISGYVLLWILTIIAAGLFTYRIYKLFRYISLGHTEQGYSHWWRRAFEAVFTALTHWDQLKDLSLKDRAGMTHAMFPLGFSIFVIYYLVFVIIGAGFGLSPSLESGAFYFYYSWIMDIVAVMVIIAAVWGLVRRYIVKPPRLKNGQTIEAAIILVGVILIPLTYLLKTATSISLGYPPAGLGAVLPPASMVLSDLFNGIGTSLLETLNLAFFWINWIIVLFTLLLIAYTRYLHMVASVLNIFFRSPLAKGELRTIDLESAETFGAAAINNLSQKQMLDLFSCVSCGKCMEACPATASGKPLNPRNLIQELKIQLLKTAPALLKSTDKKSSESLPGNVIAQDEIWACTTCRICDEVCPVYIEHVDKIVDLRRNLVLEQAVMPDTAEQAMRNIEARGHPWRGTTASRTDWAEGLDIKNISEDSNIEYLLWVGCTGALEERCIKVIRSVTAVMKAAGINFAIMGDEESCCGEPARRLGNEYLFQMQAAGNIEKLKNYNIKKIVTVCPHCYNTIKNEYPRFGGHFDIIHHSELIASLLEEEKVKMSQTVGESVTYHDPCYLGRYNDIYEQPRRILQMLPGTELIEMKDKGRKSFCCGAGGGHMWMEGNTGLRINEMRIEQAQKTGARVIATACPFCLQMFEDAIKSRGCEDLLKVADIAELVNMASTAERNQK